MSGELAYGTTARLGVNEHGWSLSFDLSGAEGSTDCEDSCVNLLSIRWGRSQLFGVFGSESFAPDEGLKPGVAVISR